MITHTFFVTGTHCAACKALIEEILSGVPGFFHVTVSLTDETVTLHTTRSDTPEQLATELTSKVREHGYTITVTRPDRTTPLSEWFYALIAVTIAVLLLATLDSTNLISHITSTSASLVTAFLIGLIASVSTCLAIVGGLVLSVSATYARNGRGWKPQALFHIGRLGGFFILGGLLGAIGESVHISLYGSAILGTFASLVMLILGIQLTGITTRVRVFTLPAAWSKTLTGYAQHAGVVTPALLGVVTFFLPCGFTQSMQIAALSSGSYLSGALIMGTFAMGTLPVLGLVSFGSIDLARSKYRGVFFKAAGILVILFALFIIQNTLAVFGILAPLIRL